MKFDHTFKSFQELRAFINIKENLWEIEQNKKNTIAPIAEKKSNILPKQER